MDGQKKYAKSRNWIFNTVTKIFLDVTPIPKDVPQMNLRFQLMRLVLQETHARCQDYFPKLKTVMIT